MGRESFLAMLLLALALGGCTSTDAPSTVQASVSGAATPLVPATTPLISPSAACPPTDQDQHVYHPDRLSIQAACIRITGTVLRVLHEADGDLHIRVQVDSPYAGLLQPANQQQCAGTVCGLLVVEPVCVGAVSQADAVDTCRADNDPLKGLPTEGEHVWIEGRYVYDLDHGGWAELHPLYRWGPA